MLFLRTRRCDFGNLLAAENQISLTKMVRISLTRNVVMTCPLDCSHSWSEDMVELLRLGGVSDKELEGV